MAKRAGMYKSNKRQKELKRKKKQEEKKLRRQRNVKVPSQGSEETDSINIQHEPSEDAIKATSTNEDSETAT